MAQEMSSHQNCSRKYTAYNQAAPGANLEIMTAGVVFSPKASLCRVTVALTTASVFNVTVTDGTTEHKWGLNASGALQAGDIYVLTFGVSSTNDGDSLGLGTGNKALTYNFEVETDSVIEQLLVDELTGVVV